MKYCHACGCKLFFDIGKFCPECGQNLTQKKEANGIGITDTKGDVISAGIKSFKYH